MDPLYVGGLKAISLFQGRRQRKRRFLKFYKFFNSPAHSADHARIVDGRTSNGTNLTEEEEEELRACRAVCVINNRIARLPASTHFPAMAAAAEVRRPGGCRPCRRVHRVVVTRRRQQDSGIHGVAILNRLMSLK